MSPQNHRPNAVSNQAPGYERAREVLAELTLQEKLSQLHQYAAPIERLGIGAFTTGQEALHGLAWVGTATVFPQPPGLAATWNLGLVERVAQAIAVEVRAKRAADPSIRLNTWAPVVNALRHPGWGRNEEGYSEDTDLTAHLAVAFCSGMRGQDCEVWQTVPTLKHFLAYGNETDRSATSSHLPAQVLREYELPAFTPALEAGVAGAVMPSYNLVNGRPAHVSRELIEELRASAPGEITVVSDAQAPSSLVDVERYFPDHVTSHAAALLAGVDSFTDNDANSAPTIERVTAALERGLITEADIDRAVLRVLILRQRTGELVGLDPYDVPADQLDTPAHRHLAREATRRGVVVLSNPSQALPLGTPGRIAVVGPFADHVVHDWYSGTPPYTVSLAQATRERYPHAEVAVASGADLVALRSTTRGRYLQVSPSDAAVVADAISTAQASSFELTDWGEGEYSLRETVTGRFLTGQDWVQRASASRIGGWDVQETYAIRRRDDGLAKILHLDTGKWLRIQNGTDLLVADGTEASAEVFEVAVLTSGTAAVQTACAEADVVIVAVGNDPHIVGRETQDRPTLALPGTARAAWRAAVGVSEPILAVISSYPYAIAQESRQARAVVWTSHAGQELGHGLIDVLSGDCEPSGRLPQTWWRDAADAGDLFEYDIAGLGGGQGMTYRYNTASALYPFGHGLSYTTVRYESIELSQREAQAPAATARHTAAATTTALAQPTGPGIDAVVTVYNAGNRPVSELVALYVHSPRDLPVRAPLRRLAAWERVELAPGQRAAVRLQVPLGTMAVWDVAATPADQPGPSYTPGAFIVQAGEYRLVSGPNSEATDVEAVLRIDGPAAPVRRPATLPAAAFHRYQGVVTSDRTRELGTSIEVAPECSEGWARYDRLDLTRLTAIRLVLAARRASAEAPARVVIEARASEQDPWLVLAGPIAITSDGPYDWHEVAVPAAVPPEGTWANAAVRVALTGRARVAELDFEYS